MLAGVAIIPSAPVLVPELAGGAAAEVADLRAAVLAAAAALPPHWVVIGGGDVDAVIGADAAGTFAGFGADLPVRLGPGDGTTAAQSAALPLCALIAGWVRGRTRPDARAEVRVYPDPDPDTDTDSEVVAGRRLRAGIDRSAERIGVLVVADGANTLTPAAPGGHRPADAAVQRALDDALGRGDTAALRRLPAQVVGRAAFAVLAGLIGPAPQTVTELYRGAPYGVGYFVGTWMPSSR